MVEVSRLSLENMFDISVYDYALSGKEPLFEISLIEYFVLLSFELCLVDERIGLVIWVFF